MIEARELRIGNLVNHIEFDRLKTDPVEVFHLDSDVDDRFRINYVGSDLYQPIPLTEEWLVRFGFTRDFAWYLNGIAIYEVITKKGFYRLDMKMESIQHVHQLQNLYFALTGQELCYS